MPTMKARLRSIRDTKAAAGWADSHSVIVDRPVNGAGGAGLGFSGGQLLALAIGGCLHNSIQSVAHEMGVELQSVSVDVRIEFSGAPLVATRTHVKADAAPTIAGADIPALLERARLRSAVANSLARGAPISFDFASAPARRTARRSPPAAMTEQTRKKLAAKKASPAPAKPARERAKELAATAVKEALSRIDAPDDTKAERKRKLIAPPATEKIRKPR
ncbi:MAG: hypothetical protein BGP06_05710 [Rhizobiales bacterium 65-9]|nr:OsmC family protein [Hyphomicrobiales bacterium]OJY35366.1 MAG: hypothetical protein BGP06_05710 [Rhizobiales bacterium 65-9]